MGPGPKVLTSPRVDYILVYLGPEIEFPLNLRFTYFLLRDHNYTVIESESGKT